MIKKSKFWVLIICWWAYIGTGWDTKNSKAFDEQNLKDLELTGVTIKKVEMVSNGQLNLPEQQKTFSELPVFQRISLVSQPLELLQLKR